MWLCGVVLVFGFFVSSVFWGVLLGGLLVVCGYQQVYICLLLLYIIIVYFLFYVSSSFVWLLCNKIIFLMLFYCLWCCVWGFCIYWFPSELIFAFFDHCSVCGFRFLCVCLFFLLFFCMNPQFRMFTNEQNIYEICQKLCKIC